MRRIIEGKMYYDPALPFPNPSTEVRFFEDLGVLIEPGAPRDLFRVVYLLGFEKVQRMLLTHPHLDHLFNAIAFPEARLVWNPRRNKHYIGDKRDYIREQIVSKLSLLEVSPNGREELLDDIYVRQTDFHFPGHLVFVIKGMAFVGDAFPPIPEIKLKLDSGDKYTGKLAEYMRDVAEHAETIITAHRGEIDSELILDVVRVFIIGLSLIW